MDKEFRGINYILRKITDVTLVPIGRDSNQVRYIEFQNDSKVGLYCTAEIESVYDDIIVKDIYGTIRFCVAGWNRFETIETYVSNEKSVGKIRSGTIYDKNNEALFYINQKSDDFGHIFYQIVKVENGKLSAEIREDRDQILKLTQHAYLNIIDKSLIFSYLLHIANTKHGYINKVDSSLVQYHYLQRSVWSSGKPVIDETRQAGPGSSAPFQRDDNEAFEDRAECRSPVPPADPDDIDERRKTFETEDYSTAGEMRRTTLDTEKTTDYEWAKLCAECNQRRSDVTSDHEDSNFTKCRTSCTHRESILTEIRRRSTMKKHLPSLPDHDSAMVERIVENARKAASSRKSPPNHFKNRHKRTSSPKVKSEN